MSEKIGMYTNDIGEQLQTLSRCQMLTRLTADVLTDITICKLENWDWKEFPLMIKDFIDGVLSGSEK